MCNTSLHFKVIFLFLFALYVINFHRQTNTFCWKGEIKVFVFCLHHTNNCVFEYSGVSAIRASTKPILRKMFFGEKRQRQKLVIVERAFLSELSSKLASLRVVVWLCWWARLVRTTTLCTSILPSTFSFMQCHSIAGIGCVNEFEVEHKISSFIVQWRSLYIVLPNIKKLCWIF